MTQTNVLKCANGTQRRRVPHRERGQILYMTALAMTTIFGFAGFVIDTARMYLSYQQLQATTDAAALAGAQGLPNGTLAQTIATKYSAQSGDNNASTILNGATLVATPAVSCVSSLPIPCGGGTDNAIQVKQQVKVNMTLAQFFGAKSITIQATATASSRGSGGKPYNIAVILDQTASMSSTNSDSCTDQYTGKKYTTRNQCALVGLKALLMTAPPCDGSYTGPSGTGNCPSGGTDSIDTISVFTFPNFTFSSRTNAYTGTCSAVTAASNYSVPYLGTTHTTYPSPATPALSGTTADYQLTPFLNDYRLYDGATTLNPASNLVKILGAIGGTTCVGLQAKGGLGTFYAGALAAAQGALLAEQASTGRSGTQNAIILLTDGAATANASDLASTYFNTTTTNGGVVNLPTAASGNTTYPYYNSTTAKLNECQQGVSAAQQIVTDWPSTNNPTTIYTIAYGASTSASDCSTDSGAISPCTAVSKMASSPAAFFSDTTAKGADTGCVSSENKTITALWAIFQAIESDFTVPRLIPNGVFG